MHGVLVLNDFKMSLEIRLYWVGKGNVVIPVKGVYGPLISVITVDRGKYENKINWFSDYVPSLSNKITYLFNQLKMRHLQVHSHAYSDIGRNWGWFGCIFLTVDWLWYSLV